MRRLALFLACSLALPVGRAVAQDRAPLAARALFSTDGRCTFAAQGLPQAAYQGTTRIQVAAQQERGTVVHQIVCQAPGAVLAIALHGQAAARLVGPTLPVVHPQTLQPGRSRLAAVVTIVTPESVQNSEAAIATSGSVQLSPVSTMLPLAGQRGVQLQLTAQF